MKFPDPRFRTKLTLLDKLIANVLLLPLGTSIRIFCVVEGYVVGELGNGK